MLIETIKLLACMRGVSSSIPGRDTNHPNNSLIRPRLLCHILPNSLFTTNIALRAA